MRRSAILSMATATALLASAAGALAAAGDIPLGHADDAGTTATLSLDAAVHGQRPHRDALFTVTVDAAPVSDGMGGVTDSGSGNTILARLTERRERPVALRVQVVTCRLTVIAGAALDTVGHITLVRADHTTTRLRLRRPPTAWHYPGHVIGTIVRSPSSRLISARPFDRDGHAMTPIALKTKPC